MVAKRVKGHEVAGFQMIFPSSYHKSAINPEKSSCLLVTSPFSYGFPMVFI